MLKVDDECIRNPLKRLKLQGIDLRYETADSSTVNCLSGQFRLNPSLLELDISHCVILPRQLAMLMGKLAQEYLNPSGSGTGVLLQTLNLSHTTDFQKKEKGSA